MVKATILVTKKDYTQVEEVLEFEAHSSISNEEIIVRRFDWRIDVVDYEILKIENIQ